MIGDLQTKFINVCTAIDSLTPDGNENDIHRQVAERIIQEEILPCCREACHDLREIREIVRRNQGG